MTQKRLKTYVTGYPRIGENRELKKVTEAFWEGREDFDTVTGISKDLKARHWQDQKARGIDFISSNDFSLYDSMLDMAVLFNAVPERFRHIKEDHERYFAMARGTGNAVAMEMTKWFNTNYHYIVPELSANMDLELHPHKVLGEFNEAAKIGIKTKINLIGPVTFLALSKRVDGSDDPLNLLPAFLPLYVSLLRSISELSDEVFVQFDEPIIVRDPDDRTLTCLKTAYETLARAVPGVRLIVTTYFDHATEAIEALRDVDLFAMGLDLVCGPENLLALSHLNGKKLIAGIVDGRNIWKNDYQRSLSTLQALEHIVRPDDIMLSTSCSLLHVPYTLSHETALDPEIRSWMSFAREKLTELSDISKIHSTGKGAPGNLEILQTNQRIIRDRQCSLRIHDPAVRRRSRSITQRVRQGSFAERATAQSTVFKLPPLPTTTIGSFPQTDSLRKLRQDLKRGAITRDEYGLRIRNHIDSCIEFQERIGLDVLVHGEPERNDMVEYFGEQLSGFAFTRNGWVQSYGTRCVKPPVIYGDISRREPMTVDFISYARSRTRKPVKGILTGPVTILNWSFVRDDIERSDVCEQIALVIRDEIEDLQHAGIGIVQVDEAAFKEGYPLRKEKRDKYERWAVKCFQLAVSSARMTTQIHTHMCYSDFTDIIQTLERMDADVLAIETSRSGNRLLKVFNDRGYSNNIGPGVYDIHSPRVPTVQELTDKIRQLLLALPASRVWINPDCGLKTRKWAEVSPSLRNMVTATRAVRRELAER
ncbi:MAG: 5-methyltetrahydropteroyltriglutamate--homocysteine methyltransferase [Syntrophorhabdus sp. PtaB.Bin047]|nr:MAG: 5-methyltetrahydropteroyltriglutamate--homocysteine methyltransferase [Syntrophorhabdus sp. PtaB.Bin047]